MTFRFVGRRPTHGAMRVRLAPCTANQWTLCPGGVGKTTQGKGREDEDCVCSVILLPERDLLWKQGSIGQQSFDPTSHTLDPSLWCREPERPPEASPVSCGGGERPSRGWGRRNPGLVALLLRSAACTFGGWQLPEAPGGHCGCPSTAPRPPPTPEAEHGAPD